jgi:hypothetical protein
MGNDSDPKLKELRPAMREKVSMLLVELERAGYKPKISNAYRSAAQQLEKVRQGYANPTATQPGAHNWGLAADIIDRRWGWLVSEDNAGFFALLCDLATEQGLISGGTWFGKGGTRENPTHKSTWNRWGLGWDVAHVEWKKPPQDWKQEYRNENIT